MTVCPSLSPPVSTSITFFDSRPFLDKALRHGAASGILPADQIQRIEGEFAKGIVQIADYFDTANLRPSLELAMQRMARMISLYLEEACGGDLGKAAELLRDKTFLSLSKGGADMLRMFYALPTDLSVFNQKNVASKEDLKAKTAAPIPFPEFKKEWNERQEIQATAGFAFWLAERLGVARAELESGFDDLNGVINSGMLSLYVGEGEFKMPTRQQLAQWFGKVRKPTAKRNDARIKDFLRSAPESFAGMTWQQMERFEKNLLPKIRAKSTTSGAAISKDVEEKLHRGIDDLTFFTIEDVNEDCFQFEALTSKAWQRVTGGEIDDPAVLATVFYLLATGQSPKPTMLLREAKELVQVFRTSGFDSPAVIEYIAQHAPIKDQEKLKALWLEDLKPEGERFMDDSESGTDTHMTRALNYLKSACAVAWKKTFS